MPCHHITLGSGRGFWTYHSKKASFTDTNHNLELKNLSSQRHSFQCDKTKLDQAGDYAQSKIHAVTVKMARGASPPLTSLGYTRTTNTLVQYFKYQSYYTCCCSEKQRPDQKPTLDLHIVDINNLDKVIDAVMRAQAHNPMIAVCITKLTASLAR